MRGVKSVANALSKLLGVKSAPNAKELLMAVRNERAMVGLIANASLASIAIDKLTMGLRGERAFPRMRSREPMAPAG